MSRRLPLPPRADAALALLAIVALGSVLVSATRPPAVSVEERIHSVESGLRCPTCAGESIVDSSAPIAREMRAVVEERVRAGAEDGEIRAWFVERYGTWILLDPAASPAGGPLAALPLIVLGGLGLLLVRGGRPFSRSRRVEGGSAADGVAAVEPNPAGSLPPEPRATRHTPLGTASMLVVLVAGATALTLVLGPGAPQRVQADEAPDAAIAALRAAADARPGDIDTLLALAGAYASTRQDSLAVATYTRALALDPHSAPALIGTSTLLIADGRPEPAIPLLDRVLADDPDQPDALVYRAVARRLLAGPGDARVRADLLRFLSLVPDDARRPMAEALLAETPAAPAATPPSSAPSGTRSPSVAP